MIKKIIFSIVMCTVLNYVSAADKDDSNKPFKKTIALAKKKRRNSDAPIPSLSFDQSRPLSPGRGLKARQARSLPSSPGHYDHDYGNTSPKTTGPDLVYFQQESLGLNKYLGITSKTALNLSIALSKFQELKNKKFELKRKHDEMIILLNSQKAALEAQIDKTKADIFALISKGHAIILKKVSKKLSQLSPTTSQPDSK